MVLQFADEYLTMQQILPGNIVAKANRSPVQVGIEARRSDTNAWLPVATQRYVIAPDGDAITLEGA